MKQRSFKCALFWYCLPPLCYLDNIAIKKKVYLCRGSAEVGGFSLYAEKKPTAPYADAPYRRQRVDADSRIKPEEQIMAQQVSC